MTPSRDTLSPALRHQLGVAVHEAGHAVIGALYGARVTTALVAHGGPRSNPAAGGACHSAAFDVVTALSHPPIAAAGSVAQAIWLHGRREVTGAEIDALLAINTADAGDLGTYAASTGEVVRPRSVLPLVQRTWPAIAQLAGQLHRDGTIVNADVLAALGVSDSGGVTSSQLAQIRSGQRPVPPFNPAHATRRVPA